MKRLIKTENLSKTYGKDESIVYALKNVYTIDKEQTKLHKEFMKKHQRSSFKKIDNF